MRGTLFLVVGPSGAGKDSLIEGARKQLPAGFLFPRRVITRPEGSAGEDHIPVDRATFERRERDGAFALSWRAHGHCYAIPIEIETALAAGTNVVVNVSREAIDEARTKFAPVRVIEVTAPPDVLGARLRARGRESQGEIAERLHQSKHVEADTVVVNDGALEPAVAAFVAALQG